MSEEPLRPRDSANRANSDNRSKRQDDRRPRPNGPNGPAGGQKRPANRPQPHQQRRDNRLPEDPNVFKLLRLAEDVMRDLGPALPEKFYRDLFTQRLTNSGLEVKLKPRAVLKHRDKVADEFIPDFLVEKTIVVNLFHSPAEFNSAQTIATASAQKFFGAAMGLMLDFSRPEVTHRKLLLSHESFPTIPYEAILKDNPVEKHDELRAAMLCRSLLHIGRAQGLGFGERTYRGLLRVEFDSESLDYVDEPTVPITVDSISLGETTLTNLMTVQRSGALLVLAQQEGIRGCDKARMKHALRYLKLPWGLIVHFGRRRFEWQWIH